MAKKTSRTWTADEKLQILEEARQPHTSVAEVLRRHRVDDRKDEENARLRYAASCWPRNGRRSSPMPWRIRRTETVAWRGR